VTVRPNLKTLAAAAGVSPSTISNAYNHPEQLSVALRERILDLAAEIGYPGPNPVASSLRSRRTGSIGVLFAQDLTYAFSDPYCTELLTGIAEVATATSTNVLLMPVGPHSVSKVYSRDEELRLVQGVRQAALDGAVADGIDASHPVLRVLAERGIPVVSTVESAGPCVLVDERAAAAELGRYLRGLGHRRCVVLADSMDDGDPVLGGDDESVFPYARLRALGVRDGLGPDADVVTVSAGQNSIASGRAAAGVALASSVRPTVLVATTDVLALGALELLRERGIDEVSVSGFDDVPQAQVAGLTTVRQPVREKGRVMARILVEPAGSETRVTLPTELVVRTSTRTAPADGRGGTPAGSPSSTPH
jgi:DNA-binding LacI/PurR family transcriptional regulator